MEVTIIKKRDKKSILDDDFGFTNRKYLKWCLRRSRES